MKKIIILGFFLFPIGWVNGEEVLEVNQNIKNLKIESPSIQLNQSSPHSLGQVSLPVEAKAPAIRWKYPDSERNELAPLMGSIAFQFNTLMKAETVLNPGTVLLFPASGGPVEIEVKQNPGYNAMNYLVTPKSALEPGALYRLIIRKGPESVAGKSMESEISWTFSTYPLYYSCKEGGAEGNAPSPECLGRNPSICYGEAGAGGGPNTLMCVTGSVVSSLWVVNNTGKGPYLAAEGFHCSKWTREGILPWVDNDEGRAKAEETGMLGAGNMFVKSSFFGALFNPPEIKNAETHCPDGYEASGLWGWNVSPGRVKKQGLRCRPFAALKSDSDIDGELVGEGSASGTSRFSGNLPPGYQMVGARVFAGEDIDGLDCVIGAKFQ